MYIQADALNSYHLDRADPDFPGYFGHFSRRPVRRTPHIHTCALAILRSPCSRFSLFRLVRVHYSARIFSYLCRFTSTWLITTWALRFRM